MTDLPLLARADVVVCGGGTAGAFAAAAAAESGVSVLVLEQQGCLGGAAVNALVTPMMTSRLPGGAECSYLSRRLASGAAFDPARLAVDLERLCLGAGARLCYQVTLCGADAGAGRVRAVTVMTKKGLCRVEGRVFLDCTGDGDLAFLAGAGWEQGAADTGADQPMSLRYILGGVDLARFGAFLDQQGRRAGLPDTARSGRDGRPLYAAVTDRGRWALGPLFSQAVAAGELTAEDCAYWQCFAIPGREDALAMNHPEFFDLPDALDPFQLTAVQVRGREAIWRQLAFYQRHFPGCERAYVAQTAPVAGVRESRRIRTAYRLTAGDVLARRKFPDRVAQSAYPVDIHGAGPEAAPAAETDRPWFEIPYRCLPVDGFANLLAAGRCIGADFTAQSAVRIQPTCRVLGEAAGIAAAMAVREGVSPAGLDGERVAAEMVRRGAVFL